MVAHIILIPTQYPDPRTMGPYGAGVEATMARYGGGYQSVLRHRVTTLEGRPPAERRHHPRIPQLRAGAGLVPLAGVRPVRELRMATGRFDVILGRWRQRRRSSTTGKLSDSAGNRAHRRAGGGRAGGPGSSRGRGDGAKHVV